MSHYPTEFYKQIQVGSLKSAEAVVPLILELVKPKSVIDVGCGDGTWLSIFRKLGIEDFLGVDGKWVDRQILKIPEERFLYHDMEKPLTLERQFDLVVSLEVAEHLSKKNAENFIDSLTNLGPLVLFSAAIPFQGGMNHVNEQWQDYWAKLFEAKGYVAIDCIRELIWENNNVEWWYPQNTLLYARLKLLKDPLLTKKYEESKIAMLSLVHPRHYVTMLTDPGRWSLKRIIPLLPFLIKKAIIGRIKTYVKR
ncbi:MAG: class I SAM-dependent methyltransferase [Desulfobaccales bacterium]